MVESIERIESLVSVFAVSLHFLNMTTTKVQPPRKLTDEEDLDSFEDWWFQAECYYSRDQKFSEFFDDENVHIDGNLVEKWDTFQNDP